jgi:hypothetical protein
LHGRGDCSNEQKTVSIGKRQEIIRAMRRAGGLAECRCDITQADRRHYSIFLGGTVILLYIIASIVIPKESSVHSFRQDITRTVNEPSPGKSDNIDEMMKDIEKKAMQKEIEELRQKLAKYEKGE